LRAPYESDSLISDVRRTSTYQELQINEGFAMAKPRRGSTKYRKTSTRWLGKNLWMPTGEAHSTQAAIEAALGLPEDKTIARMLCESAAGLDEVDFVQIAGNAYRAGFLSKLFIFELGLGPLVETALPASRIKFLLERRHTAFEIFAKGIKRLKTGHFPLAKNGRPKKLRNVGTDAETWIVEVQSAIKAWLEEIHTLGSRVVHRKTRSDWHMINCAAGHFEIDWLDDPDVIANAAEILCLKSLDELCLVTDGGSVYAEYVRRELPIVNAVFDEEIGAFEGEPGYPMAVVGDPAEWFRIGKSRSRRRKNGGVALSSPVASSDMT
jgi:hypothetical protein